MRKTAIGLAPLLASMLAFAAAFLVLSSLVSRSKERGLVVTREGGAVLEDAPPTFAVRGDRKRISWPEHDGDGADAGASAPAPVLGRLPPGLHTFAWSETYMGRAPREVSFSMLFGPFAAAEAKVACGLSVAVGKGTLAPLSRMLEAEIEAAFADVALLPRARSVRISYDLLDAAVDLLLEVDFEGRSRLFAKVPLSLRFDEEGHLVAGRRGEVQATLSGTLGTAASLMGGGLSRAIEALGRREGGGISAVMGAVREAGGDAVGAEIQAQVDLWMPEVNERISRLLPEQIGLELGETRLVVDLSPCGDPRTGVRSMVFYFDARVSAAASSAGGKAAKEGAGRRGSVGARASREGGAVLTRGEPPPFPVQAGGAEVMLSISEDLLNGLLHELWRDGELERALEREGFLSRLESEMQGYTALSPRRLDLELPPVLRLEESGLEARLGELRLTLAGGEEHDLQLVAAVDGRVGVEIRAESLALSVHPSALRASCSRAADGGLDARRPCFSELLDEAEERLVSADRALEMRFPLDGIADRLPMRVERLNLRDGALDIVAVPGGSLFGAPAQRPLSP